MKSEILLQSAPEVNGGARRLSVWENEGGRLPLSRPTVDIDPTRATILVVDGNAEMLASIAVLRSQRYQVQVISSGEEVLKIARSNPPQLIIGDLMTRSLDGFGLLQKLRGSTETANVPVILVADPIYWEEKTEVLGAGADDYIVKPFSTGELLARVGAQLRLASVRQEADEAVRNSELRYRRLFEAAHDGILIIDADTLEITDVNPFLIELLGYPRQYFIGKALWEIGIFEDKATSIKAVDDVRTKGSKRYDNLPLHVRSGRRHPVEVIANIYCEGRQLVIQCNIRDIQDRVKLEFEREALMGREHAARQEAEAANEMKDLFLATLSHELRTPLTAILGWSEILREHDSQPPEIQEGLEVISRSAKMQAQLIEDLLDVSGIVSGKLRLEIVPCELRDVIRAASEIVEPAATAKGVKLVIEADPAASLGLYDSDRMQQVIWNLLSNAVKFTPAMGTVTVRLFKEDTTAIIEVKDSGAGMSQEFLPFIFDRFRQADTGTRRRSGGLGLGLSIVRHIVELHGGTVEVQSDGENTGTTFTIRLPVRAVRVTETEDEANYQNAGEYVDVPPTPLVLLKNLRLLVVDDDTDARRLLTRVLEQAGAVVTTAASAAEAMQLIEKVIPDLLISDLGMPEEDGFDLINKVRQSGYNSKKLPAIALTAFAGKEDEHRALLAGFQRHISKPVESKHLVLVIASLAGQAEDAKIVVWPQDRAPERD